jgi:hypothetical protein
MSGSGSVDATVNVNLPATTTLDLGLDDVNVTMGGGRPVVLNATTALLVAEPVTVNGNLGLDVKGPLALDVTVSLGKIVPAFVRLPYRHHFGITLFGFELVGFTIHGESQIDILDTAPPLP